jgi:murein DD-endopeptidase MepM/ murein hydrolase activator NlpD
MASRMRLVGADDANHGAYDFRLLSYFLIATLLMALCACSNREQAVATRAAYNDQISNFGLDRTALGRRWRHAATRALTEPTRVELPYAEQGALLAHEAGALSFVFDTTAGQTLEIELARQSVTDSAYDDGQVYIDVFRIVSKESGVEYEQLTELAIDGQRLRLPIAESSAYLVRIQPELLVNILYVLTLELAPSLPFPVDGQGVSAVHSLFGTDRDAGTRLHEGVDIFAQRSTPVIAVTAGRAVPRQNQLGGNVVWLNTPGVSYYYAHLENAAFDGPRQVEAGDVLGYVGNTGNAVSTPPHLHFGIYRWGHGAIDPLPRLKDARFSEPSVTLNEFEPRFVRSNATDLNLRAAPSHQAAVLGQLPQGTIVWVAGEAGDWLRARGEIDRGWIHAAYQDSVPIDGELLQAEEFVLIMDSAQADAQPIAALAPGADFYSLGKSRSRTIVQAGSGLLAGWIAD